MEIAMTEIFYDRKALVELFPHGEQAQLLDSAKIDSAFINKSWGYKEIRADNRFLAGHFPNKPIHPGYPLFEHAYLTALLLVKINMPEIEGIPMIAGGGGYRFCRPVLIGDKLEFELTFIERPSSNVFVFDAIAKNQRGKKVFENSGIRGVNNTRI
jgi:3-hydroxymyristoyl/3-hydroxydecanoyl-(acyl carrier protein) dehydratase